MKHEDAVLQLTDFLQGGLSGRLQDEMAAHLAICPECQELAETCLVLASLPREEGAPVDHPTPEEIAFFAVRPAAMPGPARAGVALHARHCASCHEEVETTRAADGEIARLERPPAMEPVKRHAGRSGRSLILVAASFLLLLAGYAIARLVVFRELRESRAVIEGMKSELQDARAWSGPVPLTVLTGDVRSEGPGETLRVAPGQPYVPIAVLPPLPDGAHADERYRFEIVSAAGETVWALDMAGDAVRAQAAASGVVTFLVPAASLPPGRYAFRVLGLDASPGLTLLKASFTVSAPG